MSSPNQYVTPEDRAKGYPFALSCVFPGGKKINGKEFHKALKHYGIEDLSEIVLSSSMNPPRLRRNVVLWGYGRATISYSDLTGFPEMPARDIPEFIAHYIKTTKGGAPCAQ